MQTLTKFASSIIDFINGTAVPLVFAVAFIVFIFGVFRFFILGGANPEKQKEGKQLMIYSVIGFAVMIAIWGLVNLVVNTFGFDSKARPDLPTFAAPSNSDASSGMGLQGSANSVSVPSQSSSNTSGSPASQPLPDQQPNNASPNSSPFDSVGPGIDTGN